MFEIDRQAYLKSLGIVQYVSQHPVAGAKQSPVLENEQIYPPHYFSPPEEPADKSIQAKNDYFSEPEHNSPPADAAPAKKTAVKPATTAGVTVTIPNELINDTPLQAPGIAKTPVAHALEFCFAWIETKQGIAFLVELSDPGVKDLSAKEYRLMADIYQALQLPAEGIRYQYFKWPLVNNPKIKQGESEARETLFAYLEGKVSNAKVSSLVLMGELPAKILGQNGSAIHITDQQLKAVLLPSPAAMMADWHNKAAAWRLLAPFRGRTF